MLDIYVASKIHHAAYLIGVRNNLKKHHINIISRWIYQAGHEDTATPNFFKVFWQVDLTDISMASAVVVYAEENDTLRGALVEIGMALALDKPVILIGSHPDFGTWQHHHLVYHAKDFDEAIFMLNSMFHTVSALANEI